VPAPRCNRAPLQPRGALQRVVRQLSSGKADEHVSYRDSKLTLLLQVRACVYAGVCMCACAWA
jgi:hypothetical protein